MADEEVGLWFVTDVETSETVEIVEGGRGSEDIGGGFGSSAVQAVRKNLTQRVQISADELKRQIRNLLAAVGGGKLEGKGGIKLSFKRNSGKPR